VAGRYESADVGAVYEIVPAGNGIIMRMENVADKAVTLSPVERDTYMLRMMIVRFRRDASGRVTGFTYSNPVAKGIQFTRVGDLAAASADAPSAQPSSPAPSAPATPSAGAAAPKLDAFVGEYEMAPGRTIVVTLENGKLYGEPTGNPKRVLAHVSGTTFDVEGAPAPMTVTFTVGAGGRVTEMVMKRDGQERTLRRIR
jgi:hypothetical protein